MKNLLKFATILLVLLAMVGAASAAIAITPSIVSNQSNIAGFNISATWTDDDTPTDGYDVVLDNGAVVNSQTVTALSYSYSAALSPGIYTLIITQNDSVLAGFEGITFEILPFADFHSLSSESDSTDSEFNLTWVYSGSGSHDVEILNGNSWVATSSDNYVLSGSNSTNTPIVFRLNDSGNISAGSTITTFNKIDLTPVRTSTSVSWTIGTSGWSSFDYTIQNNTTEIKNEVGVSGSTASISVDSPVMGDEYTLTIRGNNNGVGGTGYGLWTSNGPVSLDSSVLIDITKTDRVNSAGVPEDFSFENDTILKMNATTLDAFGNCNFTWTLNNSTNNVNVTTKNNTNNSTFEWKFNKVETYTLKLEIEKSGDSTVNQILTWTIIVTEKSTGNRIWDISMPTTYTWDARSFAGFYYDLDTGEGNESMTITGIGRSLDKNSIHYETSPSTVDFAYSGWNQYQIVGFMGDKYYAGSGSVSLMNTGNLSKVLVDDDESKNYRVGQYIALEEGYSIRIDQISVSGNQAYLVIEKDGKEVAAGIVGSGSNGTFVYEKKIGNVNIPFIRVHVNSVFQGSESSLVTINGLFQISDKLTKLESGTKIDKMEITGVSGNKIEMTNPDRISLSQDSEVTLMGKMKFIVADSSDLRFAPTIEYVDPGIYEIRGTVSDYNNADHIVNIWTPQNFEGFYYNINDNLADSEKIEIKQGNLSDSQRRIDKGNLTYTANTTIVDYEYSPWGTYSVVGFMGDKYYAGLGGSLLKGGNLSKVLIDADESRRMNVGQYITLEEGYSIKVDQIDVGGNSTYLILEKDGRRVADGIVRSGNDFVYEKNISNVKVEFIKVHVDSVFMGTESSLVSISGLFQASDNLTKLESGTKYGKMEMDTPTSTGISLTNSESITLSGGNDVEFMKVGNNSMYFKVGDNNTLRFAPVVEREIGSTSPLDVKVSPSEVEVGSRVEITVMDRGTSIEGVTVSVNGSSIGTTNSSGIVEYTTNSVGTIRVLAEKSGYVNGSASLTVKEKSLNMTISVSPDTLYYGSSGTIRVTDSMVGSAVSGVSILVGDASAGTTDSNGELTYTFNTTGNVTIQGSKTGYINATRSVSVTQRDAFNYSNFTMKPDSPAAKSNTKISFDATNVGVADGSHTLKLTVTDSSGAIISEDSKDVSVNVGKTKGVTLSFKAPAEGNYRITLTESDSNRVIDLPSSMSSVHVGPSKMFGSTLIYIVLAIIVLMILVVLGGVAYLFGVKGATRSNYKEVAGGIASDVKAKFKR